MSIDFSSLSPKALAKLIAEATREHKRKQKRPPIMKVRAKLIKLAKSDGYTIAELFGNGPAATGTEKAATKRVKAARKSTSAGKKIAPKYRNPDDPSQTWTGRGKAPLWFNALLAAGKTREDLLIK